MSAIKINIQKVSKRFALNPYVATSIRDEVSGLFGLFKRNEKEYFDAVKEVSFKVNQGEILGLIGPNGAGKTTLLKILSRISPPSSGSIEIYGKISSLLEVGTGFHPELTGIENIYVNGAILGMTRMDIKKKFDEIVSFSGVEKFLNTAIKHYSSGMQMRLAFSVAAHLDADILLIDEVLSVGDAAFQKKCLGKMNELTSSGRTVIFVSHNMGHIKNLCSRGIYLNNGRIQYQGNIGDAIDHYLNFEDLDSSKEFKNKPIQSISIKQENSILELEALYDVREQKVLVPSLGFVIYDQNGIPIAGTNPVITGDHIGSRQFKSNGKIVIRISQPKLLDGQYYLSFWFGIDGHRDIQFEDKILRFSVIGMAHFHKSPDANKLGSSAIECNYRFE